jgi:protein-tyrosine kinase
MSIIEQATKRLEQLERAGVAVPWSAARVAQRSGQQPQPAGQQDKAASPVVPIQASPASSAAVSARAAPRARTQVTLDLAGLREFGYLVPDQVRSEMAEQFRHLKRPLLKNARAGDAAVEQRGALIMMTSAMPGEGKTFCSINLAMSMAMEVDTAVILVDADVVRPSVFARMGINAKPPGLLDLLNRDDLELDDALVATNVPKLLLMASGDPDGRSTELLASASMDRILTKLATDYSDHIVIFDAPPVLLTTESTVLASKVGQVVMVVEAAKTARHTVEMAFAALRHCPIVLSVLNKCDEPSDAKRYGYYYG